MNQQRTTLPGFEITLTAHQEDGRSLLLASMSVDRRADARPASPIQVALVIDRSGSMAGEKLEITKAAVAQFIRSLGPDDRVTVISYDDNVRMICNLQAPSEDLARQVEQIREGGSTNLYDGWVMGAKLVGRGGRVILLSDGQANAGRFTHASDLAAHAGLSYQKFGVSTSTIGVGRDYDEALMAGMAREGGGAHYFAHDVRAITEAFSQERYSAEATILSNVSLRYQGQTEQLGHFWGGEVKNRVFQVVGLKGDPMTVRYTNRATGKVLTETLTMPTEFGYSEDVRLEHLFQRASETESEMLTVRSPNLAAQMRERLRAIVLEFLAHPASDQPLVMSTIDRLKASIERLEQLERHYNEDEAMMHRKRSQQSSYNLRERGKAYSSFDDDKAFVMMSAQTVAESMPGVQMRVDPAALKFAPKEEWRQWLAVPIEVQADVIVVAMEDPRRGFVIKEIEVRTKMRVRPVFAGIPESEIRRLIDEA